MENINPSLRSGPSATARDFFINLGVIVALYTVVFSLVNMLFTVINKAYPQITTYYYPGSYSISFPTASIIIFFPIFILLSWILNKDLQTNPDKKNLGIHKWLTYITLFIAGLAFAGDLVSVLYYYLDGQELTTGFLLKALVVLVLSGLVFTYYITEARRALTNKERTVWRIGALVIVVGSIIWGFSILGSPRTQQLLKYDEQKIMDLQNINSFVLNYYQIHAGLPAKLSDLTADNSYSVLPKDPQTGVDYEYVLVGQSAKAYQLCATFNNASDDRSRAYPVQYGMEISWAHPDGHYCFTETLNPSIYPPTKLPM